MRRTSSEEVTLGDGSTRIVYSDHTGQPHIVCGWRKNRVDDMGPRDIYTIWDRESGRPQSIKTQEAITLAEIAHVTRQIDIS